jgi:hypothetical protein
MRKKLIDVYKSFNDKPLHEQRTFGDLSPEEWEAEREKTGMKTDDEGNMYIDNEYDPGNEPLEIVMNDGPNIGESYFIEPEDIEAYVNGETVMAVDPDRGMDEIEVSKNNSDVTAQGEEMLKSFAEGTCGYGVDGELRNKPAGSYLNEIIKNPPPNILIKEQTDTTTVNCVMEDDTLWGVVLDACFESGPLHENCTGNGGYGLDCQDPDCTYDATQFSGHWVVEVKCGMPTYDPPTPDFDQSFYDTWQGDYGHHPGHGITPDKTTPDKTMMQKRFKKLANIKKK